MEIPRRILAYAEVVADTVTGVAHRPKFYTYPVDAAERYPVGLPSSRGGQTAWAYRPKCHPEKDAPPAPTWYPYSAGWADKLGYEGCQECWPEGEA